MTMTATERAAYDRWVNARPNRYGTALLNAFLDGYRARNAEHIEACHTGCVECADERAFGECSKCGGTAEAIGPDELSRCCGSRVILAAHDRVKTEHARLTREESTERAFDRVLAEDPWEPRS